MIKLKKMNFLKFIKFLSICVVFVGLAAPVNSDNPDEDFSKAIDAEEKRIKWGTEEFKKELIKEMSSANIALFINEHLGTIKEPSRLYYKFEKKSTREDNFVGNVVLNIVKVDDDNTKHITFRYLKGRNKVIIKNLIIDASIGIHKHEKIKKQRVSISLSIEVVDNISLVDHNIENFLSYENVINNIKLIINKGHIDLVETLSYEILSNIFSDSRASKVWLKIEKLDVFEEAQSVGLEIVKTRKNFIKSSNSQNIKKLKNK